MHEPLVVVPTAAERNRLLAHAPAAIGPIELCGFGLAAAAARTAHLVARRSPSRVILAGIAGRFDDSIGLGAATLFERVACHGIGVGTGAAFLPAAALGWPQWPGDPADRAAAVGDSIGLADDQPAAGDTPLPRRSLLLSAAAGSADAEDARLRRGMFPGVVAEDMEGFGVALACRLAGVPCSIVRGISNTVGDRDTARWRIDEALAAAAGLVARLLEAHP